MKKIFLLTLLILTLFSCGSNEKSDSEKRKELQEKKEELVSSLVKKHDIKYLWDTLDFSHSLSYEPVIQSKRQLIQDVEILDVYREDSLYFVRISSGFYPVYNFILNTPDEGIIQTISKDSENSNFLFTVEIERIKKGLFELTSSYDEDSYIELEHSSDFYGRGKIIEITEIK